MAKKGKIHFEISERKILLRIFDLVFVFFFLYAVSNMFNFNYFKINSLQWVWIVVLSFYLTTFSTIFELYDLQKTNLYSKVFQNIVLASSITVLFYLLTPFYTPPLPDNRLQIIYFYFSIVLALSLWRFAYITIIASPRFYKNVIVVGNQTTIQQIIVELQKADPNFVVVGYINIEDNIEVPQTVISDLKQVKIEALEQVIGKLNIGEIIIASSSVVNTDLYAKLIYLLEKGFPVKEYSQVYEELTNRIFLYHFENDFYKYLSFSRSNKNKLYLFFSRFFDIFFSIVGLLIGLLISPFILLLNAFWNKGPLLYSQTRIGRKGKSFKIIKFRTMVLNAEENGAQWAKKGDKRITTFGNFLRKTRLDEIPQFLNILNGDMSFIGPRPEQPFFVQELIKTIPYYQIRHSIKPGLTGWAQVNTSYAASEEEHLLKLQYDLYYIKHRGLFLDLRIVLKTLSTVIFYRGQ